MRNDQVFSCLFVHMGVSVFEGSFFLGGFKRHLKETKTLLLVPSKDTPIYVPLSIPTRSESPKAQHWPQKGFHYLCDCLSPGESTGSDPKRLRYGPYLLFWF